MDFLTHLSVLWLLQLSVCWAQAPDSSRSYFPSDGSLLLNDTVSTDIINVTDFRSDMECLAMCTERGCAAVSVMLGGRICQLLIIKGVSSDSDVFRTFGSETGAKVWKSENFALPIKLPDINVTFLNSSTGRNGTIQYLTINIAGCYRIEAYGAKGGSGLIKSGSTFTIVGGNGAFAAGAFDLTAGITLAIVVGQKGGNTSDRYFGFGGGGGSFIYRTGNGSNQLYLAAGGGGGGVSQTFGTDIPGLPGQAGRNGTNTNSIEPAIDYLYAGFGGINGLPGRNMPNNTLDYMSHGGCGAGWLGKTAVPRRNSSFDGDHGGSLAQGWVGGENPGYESGSGGFGGGGGGGGSATKTGAPGAGGGYSGGGAGAACTYGGGGGGSFCSGLNCTTVTGGNSGSDQGRVNVRLLTTDTCL